MVLAGGRGRHASQWGPSDSELAGPLARPFLLTQPRQFRRLFCGIQGPQAMFLSGCLLVDALPGELAGGSCSHGSLGCVPQVCPPWGLHLLSGGAQPSSQPLGAQGQTGTNLSVIDLNWNEGESPFCSAAAEAAEGSHGGKRRGDAATHSPPDPCGVSNSIS